MMLRVRSWMNGRAAARTVIGLAAVSLVLRLRLALQFVQTPYHEFTLNVLGPDQNRFFLWAQGIRAGRWAAPWEDPGAAFQFSPVYPWLLSLSMSLEKNPFLGIFLLQAFLSSLTGFALWDCGRRFGCRAVGFAAAVLWLFYAPSVFFDGCLIRESLLASTGFLAFWGALAAWDRPSVVRAIAAGAALGLCSAIRLHPYAPLLIAVLLAAALIARDRRRLACAALLAVIACACQAPVAVRNYTVAHRFAPFATQGADALILGNDLLGPGMSFVRTENSLAILTASGGSAARAAELLGRQLAMNPAATLELYRRKIRMLVNDYEITANYSFYAWRTVVPEARMLVITWGWIFPFAVLGALRAWRGRYGSGRRWVLRSVLLSAGVLLAGAAVVHIQARYRFVAVPFLALLAGAGLHWLFYFAMRRRWVALSAALALAVTVGLAVRPDPSYGYRRVTGSDGVERFNRDPLQEPDYITLLAAWSLSDAKGYADEIGRASEQAVRSYGPSVIADFDRQMRALGSDTKGLLSRSYREKHGI